MRDGIVSENGAEHIEWTSGLHLGLESIYDLRAMHTSTLPFRMVTVMDTDGDIYTIAFSSESKDVVKEDVVAQGPCVVCMDRKATYVMETCRHLTHCRDCRKGYINHDRKTAGRYHESVGPSQKRNERALKSYTISCPICRKDGRLLERMGGSKVLIP